MFKTIFQEFWCELKRIFVDPGAILILVIAALSYSFVYSLPYATEVIVDIPIGICDNDNSSVSRDLVQKIESSPYLKVVSKPLNLELAKNELNRQKIYAYVDIPQDFSKNIKRGNKASISVYTDSGYLIVYRQIMTNLNLIVGTESKIIEVKKIVQEIGNFDKSIEAAMPVKLAENPLFNPSGGYESYIFPAVLILILQQTMLVGIGLLCGTDRECGHFKDLDEKLIPAKVIGRACAYVLIYLSHSAFYFAIIPRLYNYSLYHNFWLITLLLLPYLFGVAFLGQALTIFFKKRESSLIAMVVISLPLAFLPGVIWPKEAIPALLRFVSLGLPSTSAMDSILKVNQMGAGFADVKCSFLLLSFLMLIYYFAAVKVYMYLTKENN